MKNGKFHLWDTPYLEALMHAEEIAVRSYMYDVLKYIIDVDIPVSTSLGNVDFQKNQVKMIESAMIMKWTFKREYYLKLCDYGLMVNVELVENGNSTIQLLPFSAYVSMIDRLGHEIDWIKWFPTNFDTSIEFEGYRTQKLIDAGLLENDLVAA